MTIGMSTGPTDLRDVPIAPSTYFLHKAQRADHYEQAR